MNPQSILPEYTLDLILSKRNGPTCKMKDINNIFVGRLDLFVTRNRSAALRVVFLRNVVRVPFTTHIHYVYKNEVLLLNGCQRDITELTEP